MRFFLEFVSCCATSPRHVAESSIPAENEDRWLVPASVVATDSDLSRRRYRKKQKKAGALDWRPSLGSISEDVVVPPKGAVASSTGREVKKKSGARGATTKIYHRSYSDGYHGSSMIMPTFSPTPFMF